MGVSHPREALGDVDWRPGRWGDEWADPDILDITGNGLWGDLLRVKYPCWTSETSRVVSGPCGDRRYRFPGRWFPTMAAARAHWTKRARVIEGYYLPARWILRIAR